MFWITSDPSLIGSPCPSTGPVALSTQLRPIWMSLRIILLYGNPIYMLTTSFMIMVILIIYLFIYATKVKIYLCLEEAFAVLSILKQNSRSNMFFFRYKNCDTSSTFDDEKRVSLEQRRLPGGVYLFLSKTH